MTINNLFRWRYVVPVMALAMYGSPSMAESLPEAVKAALATHPAVAMTQASAQAADQELRIQRSGYFPDVSASAAAGRMFGNNATSRGLEVTRGEGYSDIWNTSVSARQPLFDGFETPSRVRAAQEQKRSSDLMLLDARENMSFRVTQAYIELMRAREGLLMLKDYTSKADEYLARIKSMVDEGASDEAEHQQARDIRVILDGLIADYEGQVRAAESNYFMLTGRLPETDLLKPPALDDQIPASIDDAIAYARDHHPSVLAARRAMQASVFDLQAEKAPLYPRVDGELSYLIEEKRDLIGGELEDGRALINMNWQFETGGAQLARIKKKKYEHAQAKARLEEMQKQIELGVRLALSELETANRQVSNQAKRRELNEKLFATYKIQFDGGKISPLQLMQGENQLFTTGLEQMNGQYRALAAQYGILASMGQLQNTLGLAVMAEDDVVLKSKDNSSLAATTPATPVGNPLTNVNTSAP